MPLTTIDFDVLLEKVNEFVVNEIFPIEKEGIGKSWNEILPQLNNAREKTKAAGLWTPQNA